MSKDDILKFFVDILIMSIFSALFHMHSRTPTHLSLVPFVSFDLFVCL